MSSKGKNILIVAGGGLLLLAVVALVATAATSHYTRSALQANLAPLIKHTGLLKTQQITGGFGWSRLQLKLQASNLYALEAAGLTLHAAMQHLGFYTTIAVAVTSDAEQPWVTCQGSFNTSIWINGVIQVLKLACNAAAGKWQLPTGLLSSGTNTVALTVSNDSKTLSIALQSQSRDLHYLGLPVLRIATLQQETTATFEPQDDGKQWWDIAFVANAATDYGPLRTQIRLLAPNSWHTIMHDGRLHLRAVIPVGLWSLAELWQTDLTRYLIRHEMARPVNDLMIIDVAAREGTWYAATSK